MKKEWFKDWFDSPYYHILYKNRDHQEAEQFLNKLIAFLDPAVGSSILDVACGKGRHAKQLAELGFHVTGIDLSNNSINEAKEIDNNRLAFFVHDMRIPFRNNQFDLVFNFFTSFGYFDSESDNQDAIDMMSEALKMDGILVIDYLNAGRFSEGISQKETKEIDAVIFHTEKKIQDQKIVKTISLHDTKNDYSADFAEAVSLLSLDDFQKLASKAGLVLQSVFGDYNLNPFVESTSERLILVLRKA
jgi:SAM-dependent methyltransferase